MKEYSTYEFKTPPRIYGAQNPEDYAYGIGLRVACEIGDLKVEMDKPGRVLMYAAVQFGFPDGFVKLDGVACGGWLFDERVVATVGKLIRDNWDGEDGAHWPAIGEEVRLLEADEAKAWLEGNRVPEIPEKRKELRDMCELICDNGMPDWV